MATTFGFFTNSSLTTPFGGLEQLINKSDFSDNPQSFVLYFGSPNSSRTLQTVASPGSSQITLTPTDIMPKWIAATAYSLGALIEPTTPNGFIYKVTTAGTSAPVTEPTWPTSINSTVIDNSSVVWTCYAQAHATTEIRLALSGGSTLASATPGAALNLGTTILGGSANCIPVYFSVTNAVSTVSSNTGYPQLGININNCQETG